jgi:hypothetical protein
MRRRFLAIRIAAQAIAPEHRRSPTCVEISSRPVRRRAFSRSASRARAIARS